MSISLVSWSRSDVAFLSFSLPLASKPFGERESKFVCTYAEVSPGVTQVRAHGPIFSHTNTHTLSLSLKNKKTEQIRSSDRVNTVVVEEKVARQLDMYVFRVRISVVHYIGWLGQSCEATRILFRSSHTFYCLNLYPTKGIVVWLLLALPL